MTNRSITSRRELIDLDVTLFGQSGITYELHNTYTLDA